MLRNLVDVDVLGEELAKSHYTWLTTAAGLKFLVVGQVTSLFVFPSPDGSGYHGGRVDGDGVAHFCGHADGQCVGARIRRLDDGALPADQAVAAMEEFASRTGWTYSNKAGRWKRGPASDAQKRLLGSLGVPVPDGLTKGQASDALSVHKVSSVLDPVLGHYVRPVD